MKTIMILMAMILIATTACFAGSDEEWFRCGIKLIRLNDSYEYVRASCGTPIIEREFYGNAGVRGRLVYKIGESKYRLTFEGGKLKWIEQALRSENYGW